MANPEPVDDGSDGAGIKPRLQIWYMDDSDDVRSVSLPRSHHGVFYSGCAYVVLSSKGVTQETLIHDLWYWTGEDASMEQVNCAADTVEELFRTTDPSQTLDCTRVREKGSHHFRYFAPCPIFRVGRFIPDAEDPMSILYEWISCDLSLQEVVCDRASLDHTKILVLDTKTKIFQFNGSKTYGVPRAYVAEKVVPHINDRFHDGKCEIVFVEDGTHDADNSEFLSFFGGYALSHFSTKNVGTKLFSVLNGTPEALEVRLKRDILETKKCYLLQLESEYRMEVYAWMGIHSPLEERKIACMAAKDLACSLHQSECIVIRVIEGFERFRFRSKFGHWLDKKDVVVSKDSKEEGAGAGVNLKRLLKAAHDDSIASLKFWRLDGDRRSPLMGSEVIKLYSGDCYIFSYSFTGELGDQHVVGTWFGRQSLKKDKLSATTEARIIAGSLNFWPVQMSIFEGNEPIGILSVFQNLIVCKGGISTGYKQYITDVGLPDVTHSEAGLALFQVQKIGSENMKAIQVEAVASSLHSSYCYILQSGSSCFTWFGKATTPEDHKLLKRKLNLFKPNVDSQREMEGSESKMFWDHLGGKHDYASQIIARNNAQPGPHLYSCYTQDSSDFKFNQIQYFDKDSLHSESMFLLEFKFQIHIWVGQMSFPKYGLKDHFNALNVAEDYLKCVHLGVEDISSFSIFTILEGSEPMFFRKFFKAHSVEQNLQSMLSAVTKFETYLKESEFQKEVLEFALERNLLKRFLEDQNLEDVQKTRDHLLMSLERAKFFLDVFDTGFVEDHNYLLLAEEADEFMKLKTKKRKRP